ncbi:uncharacterized protein LOC126897845 isoform X2 [Daktulosphaira vitifoliae]|uniref:uncharacterized protein LOC126897845 isoform X2 n=1 Tax=Daktulosphaira vitifoliae TaxID=58002 RepID=UPI0021AA2492|nr:uncharacterized protein LOC126897845 isoform X2 [Daktulosphaira vitifoliae]
MSAVKTKISEDNITTFLAMRSHFKKIYDAKPRVNCWSKSCPNKKHICNTVDIRDLQESPNYCNSTISSSAKKSKIYYSQQKLNLNALSNKIKIKSRITLPDNLTQRPKKSLSVEKPIKYLESNISDDSANLNDDDYESMENNSRACSVDITCQRDEKSRKLIRQQYSPEYIDRMNKSKSQQYKSISYSKFLEEITNEIVRLELSTDNALKTVFHKHIKNNTGKLNKKKMIEEVNKLQDSLELPLYTEDNK